jgi:hypothetical protein
VQTRLPSAAEVQRALNEVYSRPEFHPRSGLREWVQRHLAAVLYWLLERISALGGLRGSNPVLFWIIVGWLVLAVIALLAHIIWSTVQAARGGEEHAPGEKGAPRAKPRAATDWEAEAARLAAAGRLREAALALYQALLLRLDAAGAVRFDASKTPGDYRREARAHPDEARRLGGFLRLFEPVAFGGRDVDPEGWERLRSAAAPGGAGG